MANLGGLSMAGDKEIIFWKRKMYTHFVALEIWVEDRQCHFVDSNAKNAPKRGGEDLVCGGGLRPPPHTKSRYRRPWVPTKRTTTQIVALLMLSKFQKGITL